MSQELEFPDNQKPNYVFVPVSPVPNTASPDLQLNELQQTIIGLQERITTLISEINTLNKAVQINSENQKLVLENRSRNLESLVIGVIGFVGAFVMVLSGLLTGVWVLPIVGACFAGLSVVHMLSVNDLVERNKNRK